MPSILELLRLPQSDAPPVDSAEQDRLANAEQSKWSPLLRKAISAGGGAIDALLGAAGIGPDTRAAAGGEALSMLPMGSFIREPAKRMAHLAKLISQAPTAESKQALTLAAKRHPRLTAHYTEASALSPKKTSTAAGMTPKTHHPEARAELQFNTRVNSPADIGQSIAHESGHMADIIRVADRARHAGIQETPGALFLELYKRGEAQAGSYNKNPWETRARTAEAAHTIDRGPGRFDKARELGRDPTESMLNVARSLGDEQAMINILAHQSREMPAVRRVPDPGTLTDLLAQLDSRFVR